MIGQTITHYRILERLGEGGMGVVYLAEDLTLRRRVALKFLPPDLPADPDAQRRLVHEALAAAALLHPNICPVYDIAESERQTFIVMAHLEGRTLRARMAEGRVPLNDALAIVRQIGEGLAAAHEKGIVHRDLKPANVMLTSAGWAVLMDFGLARVAGTSRLTKTGVTIGTAAYMAPEQALGQEADERADVWSLGVLLYELVTGAAPFRGEQEAALAYAIVNVEPEPPSRFVPGLPTGLDGIVSKALAKKPARRYANAAELVADIAAIERDRTAEPAGHGRAARQRRGLLAVAVVGLSAMAVAVTLIAVNVGELRRRLFERGPRIQSLAVLPLENLSRDPEQEYFADGMTDELITTLSKVHALRVTARSSSMSYRGSHKSVRAIGRSLGVDAVVEGTVVRAGNQVRITAQLVSVGTGQNLWAEDYERDLKNVLTLQGEVAQAITRKVQVAVTPEEQSRLSRARAVDPAAYDVYLRGHHALDQLSVNGFQEGLRLFQRAIDLDPGYAAAYAGLSQAYYDLSETDRFSDDVAFLRARAAAIKAIALDGSLAEGHTALGRIEINFTWDWASAERELQRAIQLNPSYAPAHLEYSFLFRSLGEYSRDREELEKARSLDPLNRYVAAQAGWPEYFARRNERARSEFERALRDDPSLPMAHGGLGLVLEQQGDYVRAISELAIARASLPVSDYTAALGHAYAVAGRVREARAILDSLLHPAPNQAVGGYDIAIVYAGLGDRGRSLTWIARGLEDRKGFITFLKVDPRLDPLRSDPRFQAAMRRMHLADDASR
jgi:serine/threonine protein kinase